MNQNDGFSLKKIFLYSVLLIVGLIGSQLIGSYSSKSIRLSTMFCLSFIMIHVGYHFEIDKTKYKQYAWDYVVGLSTSVFPWVLCAGYFFWVIKMDSWKDAFLFAKFASPTSAGILFSMLAAAGFSAAWLFRKARLVAIFDDLNTILLMIPLKVIMVGLNWQLGIVAFVLILLLWMAWTYFHSVKIPITWPWVMAYAAIITSASELSHVASKMIEDVVPVYLEVLIPAFALGCMLNRPVGFDPHLNESQEGHQEAPPGKDEQLVATIVSGCFMILAGLSMPKIAFENIDWVKMSVHVLLITFLSNLGKMTPFFCYRNEATLKERLALSIAMFPRGEVGAGILVVSLSYGLNGIPLKVAVLSLALNLLLTGLFIRLIIYLMKDLPQSPSNDLIGK